MITDDQLMAEALLPPDAPEAALYFTARSLTSTVNSVGMPTTVIEAALAAIPVQRRVSLAAVLLAKATLSLAEVARKPVATVLNVAPDPVVVTMSPVSPEKPAPTPTNKLTLVKSIVSKSKDTDPFAPSVTADWLLLPNVKAPAAST